MAVLLAASVVSAVSSAGIGIAFLGAVATFGIGLLNYLMQRRYIEKQLGLIDRGQVTDRFTKAVEQLGSNNSQVRMGAIYALERIAQDSRPDGAHVADMIAALVRDRSPVTEGTGYVPVLKVRAPDVQVALRVLSRRPVCDAHLGSPDFGSLDLSRTDLRRASLIGAQLQDVDLNRTRLEGADLTRANLRGADLTGANVGRFDPTSNVYKRGADLSGADLTGAAAKGILGLEVAVTDGTMGLEEAKSRDKQH